jgi:hypothetical protein
VRGAQSLGPDGQEKRRGEHSPTVFIIFAADGDCLVIARASECVKSSKVYSGRAVALNGNGSQQGNVSTFDIVSLLLGHMKTTCLLRAVLAAIANGWTRITRLKSLLEFHMNNGRCIGFIRQSVYGKPRGRITSKAQQDHLKSPINHTLHPLWFISTFSRTRT